MMSKVVFEFDEAEDRYDVNLIVNRHKLVNALDEIKSLRRSLYKGYYNEGDYVLVKMKDKKPERMITHDEIQKANLEGKFIEESQGYVKEEHIIDEIDRALEGIYEFLE